jgi:23S rRNA pseudouridine1911/1915/1917 synthase
MFAGKLQGLRQPPPQVNEHPVWPSLSIRSVASPLIHFMSSQLDILFEDNHCLAVAKPAPLLTQGAPIQTAAGLVPTLESMVKDYLKVRYHKNGRVYLGIPHRLDRPVTGVIVFARNTKAARRLAEQFQQHQVTKIYWALVEGRVDPEEGVWEDWLLKIKDEARSEIASPESPGARSARTLYRVLSKDAERSLLEVRPETGRMHQIRLQASARGHPIRGDFLYGAKIPFGPVAVSPRDRMIALHARSLSFLHPIRYKSVHLEAPLPEPWRNCVDEAGCLLEA